MKERILLSLAFLILPVSLCAQQAPPSTTTAQPTLSEPKWPENQRKELLAKARRGDANSQMWLGTAYEQGWFGEKSFSEALKWYKKSAAKGNPDAQNSLGQMYEDGEGVKQSYVLAAKWYRKAAEHVPDFGGAGQEGTIWDCSIWRGVEFPETTFRPTCGFACLSVTHRSAHRARPTCLLLHNK